MGEKNEEYDLKKLLIRTCEEYKDEYENCKSFKARFHQYFIDGEMTDCSVWKKDYNKCLEFEKTADETILDEIAESEKKRRQTRLAAHVKNNVWSRRKEPPKNWDSPLPDWLKEKMEYSYLNYKSLEEKGKIAPNQLTCNIL